MSDFRQLIFRLSELGLPSKTGEHNDAVTLDGPDGEFLRPCLAAARATLAADAVLLDTTAGEFASLLRKLTGEGGAASLEAVP